MAFVPRSNEDSINGEKRGERREIVEGDPMRADATLCLFVRMEGNSTEKRESALKVVNLMPRG
jgi:hypothetical protein